MDGKKSYVDNRGYVFNEKNEIIGFMTWIELKRLKERK